MPWNQQFQSFFLVHELMCKVVYGNRTSEYVCVPLFSFLKICPGIFLEFSYHSQPQVEVHQSSNFSWSLHFFGLLTNAQPIPTDPKRASEDCLCCSIPGPNPVDNHRRQRLTADIHILVAESSQLFLVHLKNNAIDNTEPLNAPS